MPVSRGTRRAARPVGDGSSELGYCIFGDVLAGAPELQRDQIAGVAKREGLKVVEIVEELDASSWGKLQSATEQSRDDPSWRMLQNVFLAAAENERKRARDGATPHLSHSLDGF